jgi:hypothetical protein
MENCVRAHCCATSPAQIQSSNAVVNVFTNYLNQVAETDIPIVRAGVPKAA